MAKILIAIDGTGPWSDDEYTNEMRQSFVNQIYQRSSIPMKFYQRGPSMTGIESSMIGLRGLMGYFSGLQASGGDNIDIYITGYSRGAMICVYVANRIAEWTALNGFRIGASNLVRRSFGNNTTEPSKISIKKIILFDAVDSDATMAGPGIRKIPGIVERVHHFVCNESSSRLPRSRWYFDRIALEYDERSTTLAIHRYACTHAAIGGLPGQGDHRIPASGRQVVEAGAASFGRTGPLALINPAVGTLALGRAAVASLGTAWDSIQSNVTLDDDFRIYKDVLRDLNGCLGGFEVNCIQPYSAEVVGV